MPEVCGCGGEGDMASGWPFPDQPTCSNPLEKVTEPQDNGCGAADQPWRGSQASGPGPHPQAGQHVS